MNQSNLDIILLIPFSRDCPGPASWGEGTGMMGSTYQEEQRTTTLAPSHDSESPEIPLGASGTLQVSPCPRWAQAGRLDDGLFCSVVEA